MNNTLVLKHYKFYKMKKYLFILSVLFFFFISCNPKSNDLKSEGKYDTTNVEVKKPKEKLDTISFSLDPKSFFFEEKYKKCADSALIIAAAVLNSEAFRDSISKYVFTCKNYLIKCRWKCDDCSDTISTKTIFDSIYRNKSYTLRLILKNIGKCGGTFGESSENSTFIESEFITINCDNSTVSFAYKYAYHICHEYMHIVGFYHYSKPKKRIRNEDITEKTVWLAADILEDWQKRNIKIMGL